MLTLTAQQWKTSQVTSGLTVVSADLKALNDALAQFHSSSKTADDAKAVKAAFNTWHTGNHPGELGLLGETKEFKKLKTELAKVPNPPKKPQRPEREIPAPTFGDIVVALWTVKNRNHNWTFKLDQRLKNMDDALDDCHKAMMRKASSLSGDNEFQGIFLAPEYHWAAWTTGARAPMLDSHRLILEQHLLALSRKYPKILILPGTVFYEFQTTAKTKIEIGYNLLKAAKDAIQREQAELLQKGKSLTGLKPSIILNEEMHHNPTGTFSDRPSLNRVADALTNKKSLPKVARNVAYLLLDGKIIAQYDKHTDFYETMSVAPEKMMFVPGTQDHCPEIGNSARKHRFGVEICFDHGNAVLVRRNPPNLHFHIVVSDSVSNQQGHFAMTKTGYFLHASTDYKETVVFRRTEKGNLEDLKNEVRYSIDHQTDGIGKLDTYLLPLPHHQPPRPLGPKPELRTPAVSKSS